MGEQVSIGTPFEGEKPSPDAFLIQLIKEARAGRSGEIWISKDETLGCTMVRFSHENTWEARNQVPAANFFHILLPRLKHICDLDMATKTRTQFDYPGPKFRAFQGVMVIFVGYPDRPQEIRILL
jgi:hypothetical protein